MGCLKPLEECAARSTSGRRRKGYALSLAGSSICRGQQTSNMRRAFFGEQEAAAQIAKHGPRLSMGCLKPLEECAARIVLGGIQEARVKAASRWLRQAFDRDPFWGCPRPLCCTARCLRRRLLRRRVEADNAAAVPRVGATGGARHRCALDSQLHARCALCEGRCSRLGMHMLFFAAMPRS